ncbi:MAG: sulfotransferase domain-containing protein [Chloroflexota bacterium]|nr:sulfotransferase domain-containing protein [Chloroflexota bacterium]
MLLISIGGLGYVLVSMKSSSDITRPAEGTLPRSKLSPEQEATPSSAREINTSIPIPLLGKFYRGITYPMRILPDFLIIGTQRGGTTSLFHYLQGHPSIKPAVNKDLHFFDRKYNKGLPWYQGHFPTRIERYYVQRIRKHSFLTGEASPSYMFHPYTPKRVAETLPHVKLIVMLRNPVSRAYSQYHHAVELGHETLSFEEAIETEQGRIGGEHQRILENEHYYSEDYKHRSYLSKGIYVDQLQTWMKLFPREQFLILKSEDFYADPSTVFKQVLTFLNVPETELRLEKNEFKNYNNNVYSSKMDPAMRKRLIEYFKPHNARLYDFLGVNFDWDKSSTRA